MTEAPLTGELIAFAAETTLADVPEVALHHAKLTMLDTLGVALAATDHDEGRLFIDHVASEPTAPQAVIWGTDVWANVTQAAYANGYLANALDLDEGWHQVTSIVPALVALAGAEGEVAGTELLHAYVVGREVGDRIRAAVEYGREQGIGPTRKGWWHPGLISPIATAVACAKLSGLDGEAMGNAAAIASCSSGGVRQHMGAASKALHAAIGARDGLQAMRLAQRGMVSDIRFLEGRVGLLNALDVPIDAFAGAVTGIGETYELELEPRFKHYPVCGAGQTDVAPLLAWRATHSAEDIAGISGIKADLHAFSMFRFGAPTGASIGFSMPYVIAASLIDGEFGLDQLSDERLHDAAIRRLMARIEHRDATPDATIVIELEGGTIERIATDEWPQSTTELIEQKFFECARGAIGDGQARALSALVMSLEQQSVADLVALLPAGAR